MKNSLTRDEILAHPEVDHLTLCFTPDGNVNFHPQTTDPARLARGLARIVELLHQDPERILCAAGACGDEHGVQ